MSDRFIEREGKLRLLFAGPYKTRDRAEESLEDCYACDQVSQSECPQVDREHGAYWVSVLV